MTKSECEVHVNEATKASRFVQENQMPENVSPLPIKCLRYWLWLLYGGGYCACSLVIFGETDPLGICNLQWLISRFYSVLRHKYPRQYIDFSKVEHPR